MAVAINPNFRDYDAETAFRLPRPAKDEPTKNKSSRLLCKLVKGIGHISSTARCCCQVREPPRETLSADLHGG
ncbi:Hypothetical protein SMAX5B_020489 [Scophthalmus maximus]|uniref:Uncharacterized protein n=1 Tax=Scophthalmus maximus TaxID=52904 RepID=A0A2U9C1P0_SCOMX|nr:Hypothetical protein SMAX5B_020489 [Scophthalmus maximus]